MPDTAPSYRQRLVVHVVWHPDSAVGRALAGKLYGHLSRDDQNPVARGVGVPVYYRTATAPAKLPPPIRLDDADHTAVVVLIDSNMTVAADDGWSDYVADLVRQIGPDGPHRLLLVALSDG